MYSRVLAWVAVLPALSSIAAEPDHGTDELETVVVTASPIGDPDFLATIAGSADRSQILRSGGANLADALAYVPGVSGSGFAAGASRPVIRGFDANRVRTLEDGVGSFDVSDIGPDHGVPLDPLTAERIEIVRGAATLRYGSQAIGGVVNSISNRVPVRLPDEPVGGEFSAGLGSVADSSDAAGQVNIGLASLGLHADAFIRRADDYDTPEGPLVNSFVRNEGGALGGTWFAGDEDRIGLGVVRYASRYGIPGEENYIDMDQTKLLLRSAFGLSWGAAQSLTVDGGWADYEHSERDDAGASLSTFLDREWDLRAEMLAGPIGPFSESALGLQFQDRDFSALGEGADYLAPTHTASQAVFGFSEAPLSEQLRLQFGARIEDVGVTGTPVSDERTRRGFTPVSGSIGLVYDGAGPWRLGLALSSAARAPAQTELYARGPHEGSGTFEIGDPDLAIERANSLELSLRWRHGRVHADGSVWTARFDNYIYGELTGRSCSEEGECVAGDALELREMLYTQRDARYTGAEGHADVELLQVGGGVLELNLLADIVRAEFLGDGGDVPRIPPWRVGGGVKWQAERFDASVLVKYSAEQDHIGVGETPTASFTNVDAQLGWRPWGDASPLEIALTGRNLTDSLQRNAVALNKDEVPLPGRDIRLLLRAQF